MDMLKAGQYEKDGTPVLAMVDWNRISREDVMEILKPAEENKDGETRV